MAIENCRHFSIVQIFIKKLQTGLLQTDSINIQNIDLWLKLRYQILLHINCVNINLVNNYGWFDIGKRGDCKKEFEENNRP